MDDKSNTIKSVILKKYKSIRAFASEVGIPHGTLVSALNNGIEGMAYGRVKQICELLNLDPITLSPRETFGVSNFEHKYVEFCASMMCADFGNLKDEIRSLEHAGIDSFHIDIMDGRYVPNFAMSLNDLSYIAKNTDLPLDVHLMIEHPRNHIDIFIENLRKSDTIYIHPEAEYHPSTTLQKIINAGLTPGIAINPGTSVETVMEMLRIVDKVLVMSVNPGNAGQMYLPYVGDKVDRLLKIRNEYGFDLYWDGACSMDKIMTFAPKGIKGFVLGTTVLFNQGRGYEECLEHIRKQLTNT